MNRLGIKHDTSHDKLISHMLAGEKYGSWKNTGGKRTFTPKMSFFRHVPPHQLASYFVEHHPDDLRLNLP